MPGYTKFMKYLVTKNRTVIFETIYNMHHYSVIVSSSFVEKKEDLGTFIILYTIGYLNFHEYYMAWELA